MPLPPLTIKDICAICYKRPQVSLNRPHTLQKTKRLVRPNLGKWQGLWICAKCRKAMTKPEHNRKINTPLDQLAQSEQTAKSIKSDAKTAAKAAAKPKKQVQEQSA